MIVELFGPPGAGKTTLAQRIANGLQARGHAVRTLISARPSEVAAVPEAEYFGGRTVPGTAARSRSAVDTALEAVNRELMRRLPPESFLWRFRLKRYLRLLASSWSRSQSEASIVIFDQGYTQALCSLTSLTRFADPGQINAAASMLPEPAVRVCLQVPRQVLLARQQQRIQDRTLLERLLELDPATNLAQAGICKNLRDILEERGCLRGRAPMLCPDPMSEDLAALLDAVAGAATVPTTIREARGR